MIELNASCNRNGKRIITDLMEATQSHAVEKNCLFNIIKGLIYLHYNTFKIKFKVISSIVRNISAILKIIVKN